MSEGGSRSKYSWIVLGLLLLGALLLASCAAATPTLPPIETLAPTKPQANTPASGTPFPTQITPEPLSTPSAQIETRQVELEWPSTIRLGESDIVRLALIPSSQGYIAQAEFPEHLVESRQLPIQQIGGYELSAAARLEGVGFQVSPQGEQFSYLPPGEVISWRWTLSPRQLGQQRLVVSLVLHWTPVDAASGLARETLAYSRGVDVRITSLLGLTRSQAAITGIIGLVIGGCLSLAAVIQQTGPSRAKISSFRPNPKLVIEMHPGIQLSENDRLMIASLFSHYSRLVIESEFQSGYSGARTYLALPVRPDGRSDAHTIFKIGEFGAIRREFENYETFVKDTLPPITARIQHPPVGDPTGKQAIVRYTFIAEPARPPISLRQALLEDPDPTLLSKLFETFGPSWWMQRRPYTFRLGQEYDRMLPTHYVVEPESGKGIPLDGRASPAGTDLSVGDLVTLRNFSIVEHRTDGKSLSLRGVSLPGQPPLRVRWRGLSDPNGSSGRVVFTRQSLLEGFVTGLDRLGFPDPLLRYSALLSETVPGTQATIHGDLNLENILVGPGGMVWLVDFAETRDGPPLFDFAHLEAELIAHVLAPQVPSTADYLEFLNGNPGQSSTQLYALLDTLHLIAQRCLFNPSQPREYQLALYIACLGALKFANLDDHARQLLYLTAAHLCQAMDR